MVDINDWINMLMKAQEGLRFHCEFYVTAYFIIVGWLMSIKKKLSQFQKIIVTIAFTIITISFVTNLNDYYTFLNAGYKSLQELMSSVSGLENMEQGFYLMFSYERYDHLTYFSVFLSSLLLYGLIWFPLLDRIIANIRNWIRKKSN